MRKLFILAFCCMSIVYAGLKEDIEEKFNECMSASEVVCTNIVMRIRLGVTGFMKVITNGKVLHEKSIALENFQISMKIF